MREIRVGRGVLRLHVVAEGLAVRRAAEFLMRTLVQRRLLRLVVRARGTTQTERARPQVAQVELEARVVGVGHESAVTHHLVHVAHLPVELVVAFLAVVVGQHAARDLVGVVQRAGAQADRIPVVLELVPGTRVDLLDGVVVDEATRGDQLHVAASRPDGVDQQIAARVARPDLRRDADVARRSGF